jgi:SAM-dependent methyltransferase
MVMVLQPDRDLSYRDPNILHEVEPIVGTVAAVRETDQFIVINGFVDGAKCKRYSLDRIIALDGSRRFISMARIYGHGWEISITNNDLGKDNSASLINFYAIGKDHALMHPLLFPESPAEILRTLIISKLPSNYGEVPTLADKLRSLILEALNIPYISRSVAQGIETKNSYQTMALGDSTRTVGRSNRLAYLKKIDFRGKTVLDLGANTGEISRVARRLGASLVDGYEYDPYFVEIGRAVNALTGATRVSLFQGDITKPALFEGMSFDIVLSLNVWVYLQRAVTVLPRVAPLMVFETHTLDHGINYYYSRLLPYYPFCACLGLTDLGPNPHQTRAFIVFAESQEILDSNVDQDFLLVKPYFANRFLERFGIQTKVSAYSLAAQCYAESVTSISADRSNYSYGREGYFRVLLAGLHQFVQDGAMHDQNVYLKFLVEGISMGFVDPQMYALVEKKEWLKRKVTNKFEDMINVFDGHPERVPPIRLYGKQDGALRFETTKGESIICSEIDGHHRFFTFQLLGVDRIQFVFGASGMDR